MPIHTELERRRARARLEQQLPMGQQPSQDVDTERARYRARFIKFLNAREGIQEPSAPEQQLPGIQEPSAPEQQLPITEQQPPNLIERIGTGAKEFLEKDPLGRILPLLTSRFKRPGEEGYDIGTGARTEGVTTERLRGAIEAAPGDIRDIKQGLIGVEQSFGGAPYQPGLLTEPIETLLGQRDEEGNIIRRGLLEQLPGPEHIAEALARGGLETFGVSPETISKRFIGAEESPGSQAARALARDPLKVLGGIATGDIEPLLEQVEEAPISSLLSTLGLAAPAFKAAGMTGKLVEAAQKVSPVRAATGVVKALGRGGAATAEELFGATTGAGKKAMEVQREARAAGKNLKVVEGFEDLTIGPGSLPDLTRKLATEAYRTLPEAANKVWKIDFGKLNLKPGAKIDFSAMRDRMFKTLRSQGIDAKGFIEGKTRINWENSAPEFRDGINNQKIVQEIVDKMDALDARYRGKTFDNTPTLRKGVTEGNRYNAGHLHEELKNLNRSQIEFKVGVDSEKGGNIRDRLTSIFKGELGQKLDGFNDMQRKRKDIFRLTDEIENNFGFLKKARDEKGFKLGPEDRITDTTRSRLEQALGDKSTNASRRQTLDKLKAVTGTDYELAISELRVAPLPPHGIARASFSTLGHLGLVGGTGFVAGLPGFIGALSISSPLITGKLMRALGAGERVVKQIVNQIERLNKNIPLDLQDEISIAMALANEGRTTSDILTTLGQQPPQDVDTERARYRARYIKFLNAREGIQEPDAPGQ